MKFAIVSCDFFKNKKKKGKGELVSRFKDFFVHGCYSQTTDGETGRGRENRREGLMERRGGLGKLGGKGLWTRGLSNKSMHGTGIVNGWFTSKGQAGSLVK